MTGRIPARVVFAALAAGTIVLGLWVHRGGVTLSPVARDIAGDALWATMMAWLAGAAAPGARLMTRSTVAFGICAIVELSQLVQAPWIDAVRQTTMGQLVLGSGFDPRDFAAYALGVFAAGLLERATIGRRRPADTQNRDSNANQE